MVSLKVITFFVLAVVACAVAIPAGVPQPRQIAPLPRQRAANPESEQLTSGAEEQDLKASSSYGYGYYGGLGGLSSYGLGGGAGYGLGGYGSGGYYGGYGGYPYSGYSYGGYPYSNGYGYYSSFPYNRGYGGLYGGYY